MTNILFIGGAGFIGSNLIQAFVGNSQYKIYVYEPNFANISRITHYNEDITIIRGSLDDFENLKKLILTNDIEIVVHLVSTLLPGSSYNDYKNEFETVIFPTINLMSLCSELKIKLVFFSSGGTVYGNSTNEKFCESDILAPISYYGLSKQIIENNILFEHRTKKMEYLILRPSNPYGPGQSLFANQGLIAVSLGKIINKEPITIWGDGNSVRDYIYIDDLSKIFFNLIDNGIKNEIVNIGSGEGHSINDIIFLFHKIVSENLEVSYEKSRNVDVSKMVLDIRKLQTISILPQTSLEAGIRKFYDYINTIK
jgi:UDP-glucose 4-epimerase